jgi:hypothetical protein
MAAHRRYPTPAEQFVSLARAARLEGMTFEQFWTEVVFPTWPNGQRRLIVWRTTDAPEAAVRWPNDGEERGYWEFGIKETKAAWQEAYEQTQTPLGDAMRSLAPSGLPTRQALPSAA